MPEEILICGICNQIIKPGDVFFETQEHQPGWLGLWRKIRGKLLKLHFCQDCFRLTFLLTKPTTTMLSHPPVIQTNKTVKTKLPAKKTVSLCDPI